jgi:hypothetical protein
MNDRDTLMEERAGAAIFAPDTLLASQYFDPVRRQAARDGERRLMVAVLDDAVHVCLKHAAATDPGHRELFREAEEWIEERDASWFYSFENVCAVLDLEAEYIRRGLRAWKERARRGEARVVDSVAEPLRRVSGE